MPDSDMIPPNPLEPQNKVRELHVVKNMRRGEDTLAGEDDNTVVFADYRPSVVPSDTPEAIVPKGLSAQVLADSSELATQIEPLEPETPVQELVTKDNGTPLPLESGNQISSSSPKNGPSEPSA